MATSGANHSKERREIVFSNNSWTGRENTLFSSHHGKELLVGHLKIWSQKHKSGTNLVKKKYKFRSPGRPHQYQLQVPFPAAPEGDMVGIEEKRSVTHLQKSRFPENHSHYYFPHLVCEVNVKLCHNEL